MAKLKDTLGNLEEQKVYDVVKEIKEMRDFKKANLDFILSLTILKQLSNIKELKDVDDCKVCAISLAEIENMSEEECDDIVLGRMLCTEHIVAYLDLRKKFGLFGKKLLREMKRLGDLSIFVPPRRDDTE